MTLRYSVFIVLAAAMTTSVAIAAEAVWPKESAGEVSRFVTMLRFRIYADHCSAEVPQLEPKFASLIEGLNSRMQGISKEVLASDEFKGMKETPVPAEIMDALKDSFHDMQHNFERLDAASTCPKTLQFLGDMDDESLKAGLTANFTAVLNMSQKLAKKSAR